MPVNGPSWARSPKQWGAKVDYDTWTDRYTPDDTVALHHGGGSDYRAGRAPYSIAEEQAQLRSWERLHLGKGWRGLAYGFGLGQTGEAYRIRGWSTYGAHTGDLDGDGISNNREVIPIIFIGSGHHHTLSSAAQSTLVRLRGYLEAESGRTLRLYGHQELKGTATSCPGPKIMSYVRNHRNLTLDTPPPKEDQMFPLLYQDGWNSGPRPHKRDDVAMFQAQLGFDYGSQQGFYGPTTAADIAEIIGDSEPVKKVDWQTARALAAKGFFVGPNVDLSKYANKDHGHAVTGSAR